MGTESSADRLASTLPTYLAMEGLAPAVWSGKEDEGATLIGPDNVSPSPSCSVDRLADLDEYETGRARRRSGLLGGGCWWGFWSLSMMSAWFTDEWERRRGAAGAPVGLVMERVTGSKNARNLQSDDERVRSALALYLL